VIHLSYLTAGAWVCCSQTSSQTQPPEPCTNYLVINLLLITELLSLNLFLKFVSPLYIYSLITTMVIFARCFKCPGNISVSAGKTFATLLILSYSSILKACIDSVSFVYFKAVESNGNVIKVMVMLSTTLQVFTFVLVIISVVLLVMYIIQLPFIFLFPSKVYQFKCTKPVFGNRLILSSGVAFGLEFKCCHWEL